MADTRSLASKILDDLKKTGFPTEIVAGRVMERRGWAVLHNQSYFDKKERTSREYDLRAYRHWRIGGPQFPGGMGVYLLVECKKSEKPCVFFTTEERHEGGQRGRVIKSLAKQQAIFWSAGSGHPPLFSTDELRGLHHYFRIAERARTYHEPFKGSTEQGQQIFKAVQSAINAAMFTYEEHGEWEGWLAIYYPMIVFSGDLFIARVDDRKEVALERHVSVRLSHHHMPPAELGSKFSEWAREFVIDVVHESHLDSFLTSLESEHELIAEHIRAKQAGPRTVMARPRPLST